MNDNLITLGEVLYKDIDCNPYLCELYENILYNYSLRLFHQNDLPLKDVNIDDALRFADILSKSVNSKKADQHKILAQEIVALLNYLYPNNREIDYYLGSILSCTGNYRGLSMMAPEYHSQALLERLYSGFNVDYLSIPAQPEYQFFRSQKDVYDHLNDQFFSYSGPTSMGKSFVMRMFIKEQVMNGINANFALLVPTKALINEVTSKIINDLKNLLAEHNYRLVTSAGALVLKENHNFIFVLTPERLLYLLIGMPNIHIDHLFVDEAHKISSNDDRSAFYYKVVDLLARQNPKPRIVFASPNIPNPEVYLKLIPGVQIADKQKLASTFAPVSQVKFMIDLISRTVQLYNSHSNTFTNVYNIPGDKSFCSMISQIAGDAQNIVYCSSTAQAIELALEYSKQRKTICENSELLALSKSIEQEVHGDYYLAQIIKTGVAYHIGYLPSAIRLRIEDLFREGVIKTMFCTSTLVEGVNLPADNLFITSYKNGSSKMTPVDFRNLIGRVGRIEYNLYGNVYLVRLVDNIKTEEFEQLLTKEIPEQKLSLVSELTKLQKEKIVESLLNGNIDLLKYPKNQTSDSYSLMRKFALILLRDITKDRDSLVRKEFATFLTESDAQKIKEIFNSKENKPDDDINVSVDQTNNLTVAIAKGLAYPCLTDEGNVDYNALIAFLERLCSIFKWEKYESKTLGHISQNGTHGSLRWYAVILSQWIKGTGLSYIMEQAIQYKRDHPESGVRIKGKIEIFADTLQHRNYVIAETLGVIENIILFRFSNYFLRFSTEYKRFHNVDTIANDWYEYVEYGTINPLTIMLQRSGFSRETSTYIKTHRSDYVVMVNGELKLRRSLAQCPNEGICQETKDIQFNIPELFVD